MQSLLPKMISRQMAELYKDMEEAYDFVARQLDFTCDGCQDNCCDSYFLHHTYVEWAYLWEGLNALSEEKRENFSEKAHKYILESEKMLAEEKRPNIMCPLNEDGLCGLYSHRLMICRLHGIPAMMTRPDGKQLDFPGCFRCQEITDEMNDIPRMDRTKMYQRLVQLESGWLGSRRKVLPKVKKTIADMIVQGPPIFSASVV
ncbi:MAG: hypothetical protein GQ541_00595 [Desulfovibrionaceae bacterium]|jgi:hypothetical protein|nr:hypothetical protein [Desulfovibrionaceae bacterium]